MSKFEVFKLFHIIFAVIWVGGGALGTLFTERAKKADPAHKLGVVKDMAFVSKRVFAPASMATLVFGILMVLETSALDFEQTWIAMGIGGIVISTILGMGYLGPQADKLVVELEANDAAADVRLNAISRVARIDLIILFAVIWAMVAKPGL